VAQDPAAVAAVAQKGNMSNNARNDERFMIEISF
jgi:hypothetical protein